MNLLYLHLQLLLLDPGQIVKIDISGGGFTEVAQLRSSLDSPSLPVLFLLFFIAAWISSITL